jgi:hypothetical protein
MDHISDPAELEQIAARGKHKSAVKRARGVLREADEQQARELAARAAEAAAARAEMQAQMSVSPVAPEAGLDPVVLEAERARAAEEATRVVDEATGAADEAAQGEAREREAREREAAEQQARQQAERDEAARAAAERKREMAEREAAAKDADARVRREALTRLLQLVTRVEPLAAREDLTLKAADRALRDIRNALAAIPPLPSRQDYEHVTSRLNAALEALTPKALALREADDWQRFANVGIQEQLCERMEALAAVEDPETIAREVRNLQGQWKQAADVPRAQAEPLWRRFKTAHDVAWARCEAHFAAQAQARAENLARKIALCEKAETLADSTSWLQTAEEIKRLQAEWKTIGPVSRGREKAIWDRFRVACDRFFTRRNEDLARRKAVWSENLAKKEALCVKAEALAESTDWEPAAAELRRLQAEWKTIGPVKKSRSEPIWQRFRAAADRFFARYAQRHEVVKAERVAARETICTELEALSQGEREPAEVLASVRSLRSRWQQELAARGVDMDTARALDARFSAALAAVLAQAPAAFSGTDLDPDANRKRMEALVKKIEGLAASLSGGTAAADASATPATRLAAMLKEALAANTIGGKVDDDSKWRAAMEDVRQAQASWTRLGPVPDEARRALSDRFQRACRRIQERAAGTPARSAGPSRAGGAGR